MVLSKTMVFLRCQRIFHDVESSPSSLNENIPPTSRLLSAIVGGLMSPARLL